MADVRVVLRPPEFAIGMHDVGDHEPQLLARREIPPYIPGGIGGVDDQEHIVEAGGEVGTMHACPTPGAARPGCVGPRNSSTQPLSLGGIIPVVSTPRLAVSLGHR